MSTYGQNVAMLTNEALRDGVPPQEIILHLELLSHELKSSFLANAALAAQQASEKPLIVPPNGRLPG